MEDKDLLQHNNDPQPTQLVAEEQRAVNDVSSLDQGQAILQPVVDDIKATWQAIIQSTQYAGSNIRQNVEALQTAVSTAQRNINYIIERMRDFPALVREFSACLSELAEINSLSSLMRWKGKWLGDKGEVRSLLGEIRNLPQGQRAPYGQAVNALKEGIETALSEREPMLKAAALNNALASDKVDITLPARQQQMGHMHVISRTIREVTSAFVQMGFQIWEGPEVELDRYNFELLNIPPEHPARSMQDTFYISDQDKSGTGSLLLRTHTSPNQMRVMEQVKPPIRVVVPGRCYRAERTDATHEFYFYQMEALVVAEKVTLADLKGTLATFARLVFSPDAEVRFVCGYFSYVEPGVELMVRYTLPNGKRTNWLELLGAGMVHPSVLRNGGIDPDKYSGFAFGMGLERVALLKYGIDDIRHFYANDLRFLEQFG